MSLPQAVRDAAIADVRAGMSIAAAAKKHGASAGSVHAWVRAAGGAPSVSAHPGAPRPAKAPRASTKGGNGKAAERSDLNARRGRSDLNEAGDEGKRGREKAGNRGSEGGAKTPPAAGSRANPPDAELEKVEGNLRAAIAIRAEVLANPASLLHKDQVKIAVALDYTTAALKALPDVYKRPTPPATKEETTSRILSVFGAPVEEPEPAPSPGAKLIEINGGKS